MKFKMRTCERRYKIIKVKGDESKYGRFNQRGNYTVHEDILPMDIINYLWLSAYVKPFNRKGGKL